MQTADELRALVEDYLLQPAHWESGADGLGETIRYPLDGGGKRLRPVLCLAVGEAIGLEPEGLLPAAAALELVHTFSLVHDDLPALDDDAERRGQPSAHVRFGEGVAILAGDALLSKAFALAAGSGESAPVAVLASATTAMIEGQYLDITGADVDVLELHSLKTGALFGAAVRMPLALAGVEGDRRAAWEAFGDAFGRLFQLADDLNDGDGAVARFGAEQTRDLAAEQAGLAHEALARTGSDTAVVGALLDDLAARAT
ncbi:MAG: polyprenyl synthetase family protein [Gaiellaceae bacterium]